MDEATKNDIDAKTEATRAQNDAQFARIVLEMQAPRAQNDAQFVKVMAKLNSSR